jgi:ketosteroid isomerase-like protein
MDEQQSRIAQYVNAYNNFDVDGMTRDLDENIIFENISNGQLNLRTDGLAAFRKQAEAARQYFQKREQRITSWLFEEHKVTIDIDYSAILNVDLPNGLKAGDALELKGKSVFEFEAGKITYIVDIS